MTARPPLGELMTDELWRWQACDLARAIRTRRISSREAVTSCLARLAAVDCLPDEALAAASAADRAVATGAPLGPMHGVPVTIKINIDYTGRATTNGVVAFKDRIAQADSPPVANWRRAGAIIIGRTNVPPFSARFFTDNALYGRTLNPWDAGCTPGGLAPPPQWRPASAPSPTATTARARSAIRPMRAASSGCDRRSAASRRTSRARPTNLRSPRN